MPHTFRILKLLLLCIIYIFEEDFERLNHQISQHDYPFIIITICMAICLALPTVTLLILFRVSRQSIHTLRTRQYRLPRNLDDYINLAQALITLIVDSIVDFGDAATDFWLEEVGTYGLDADILARPMGYIFVLAIMPLQALMLVLRFAIPCIMWLWNYT